MSTTDFGTKPEQQRAWASELLRESNGQLFWKSMMAEEGGIITVNNELKRINGADQAIHKLLPELKGTGVTGGSTLRGNEESMAAQYIKLNIGRVRNAVISSGKLSDQRSVIDFRKEAKTSLATWRATIFDELMFLTMSGVSYNLNCNGATRVVLPGQQSLATLDFAADVSAPTANRHFNAAGAAGITAGNTATIDATSLITYDGILDLVAEVKTQRVKPLRVMDRPCYVLVLHPKQFAQLKKDSKFNLALVQGAQRGMDNPVFTGAEAITVDGLIVKVNDRVFNTTKAAAGSKWGATGNQNGARALLLGQQAGLVTDLLGETDWSEQDEDYKERSGISVGLMFGMKKSVYTSTYTGTSEDFGCVAFDTAI